MFELPQEWAAGAVLPVEGATTLLQASSEVEAAPAVFGQPLPGSPPQPK